MNQENVRKCKSMFLMQKEIGNQNQNIKEAE